MKKYIHYGDETFVPNKFESIKNNQTFNKPKGGLWASPMDSERGWKDFCETEGFREDTLNVSFCFTLKEGAKILLVKDYEDVMNLPRFHGIDSVFGQSMLLVDFEELVKRGYDGMEVKMNHQTYNALYGWDCDSIIIFNPSVIETNL